MLRQLRYGEKAVLQLELSEDSVLADLSLPCGQPLLDPRAAVRAALAEPLEFPPLARAVLPGDHIVIALASGVPQGAAVVSGIIQALLESGVAPEDIQVLQAAGCSTVSLEPWLPAEVVAAIQLATHDPADSAALAYLATSKDERAIYLNRQLFDADVAVAVGSLRPQQAWGNWGLCGGLFPTFSDQATQQRFGEPRGTESANARRQRCQEAEEAVWLLGAQFAVQVVPGAGDCLLQVLAGEIRAVAQAGQAASATAWRFEVAQRAELVIAAIEGGPSEQTWENLARALAAALPAVAEDGAVVLCTDLECSPGPALQRLAAADDDEKARRILQRLQAPDAAIAALVLAARQRTRIYLLSQLEEETVEDLGLAHIRTAAEIQRLCQQHATYLLLGNAQRAVVQVSKD